LTGTRSLSFRWFLLGIEVPQFPRRGMRRDGPDLTPSFRIHEGQHTSRAGFAEGGIPAFAAMQRPRDPDRIIAEGLFKFLRRDMVQGEVLDISIVPIKPHI
jgi:hypothetical protein